MQSVYSKATADWTDKYLGILRADDIKYERKIDEKKNERKIRKEYTRNQALQQKSHSRDKHLGSPSCKILVTVLKIDMGAKHKKADDDDAQGLTSER